ncbi:MAG TPA: ATP-binding protein [Nitrospirota bacterium]|nr:ATP-binding protein [Nitrospirota bacterium]
MKIDQLNEAFQTFSAASKSLETYYGELKDRIARLSNELEVKNRQLNDALADAERNKDYLKAILYNLEEAIVAVDPEGRVTTMNRSAEELLRTSLSEALGKPFAAVEFSLTLEGTDTVLEAGDKRYTVILSHSDVVDVEGCLRGRVILIKDITRLRELELRHERNQRLISMGEMAAKLVHEIRNPLCSIELFASMLEKELSTTSHRDLAQGITEGIGSLNTILTNMLFFARPNKPALKAIRIDTVIEESVRLLQPMMDSRNVRLRTSIAACELSGDAELLKQVFMNIMINAVQAMPDGGAIDVSMETGKDAVVVSVNDTGCGIPRQDLERIFDPFFSTKDSGTGLGLVIASNIMQSIGGYINVTSEPGRGSTFRLCFPVMQEGTNQERRRTQRSGREHALLRKFS